MTQSHSNLVENMVSEDTREQKSTRPVDTVDKHGARGAKLAWVGCRPPIDHIHSVLALRNFPKILLFF